MLELRKIRKIYEVGDISQTALDGVSLNFRKSEFAAILGPSGSGKTTLLNIVGGLDKYTSGDLVINNISTKKYKDADWDSYRNHRIGFVFQSYNLISHQTILQNVILALTLSGISKKEGVERAKQALIDVGLEDHIYKKPNQLSGGQMQRVAIARALVNNPDILLADEPTGALDSTTSVQIMKLLKKISKDKLVIMVTHNPELANKYANRIINLKDGKITSDTNPYDVKEEKIEKEYVKTEKTSMSFLTALSLSFNNLMTKKGRTVLVAFAGSIGIIGIALILALSTGFQNYIDKLQEDTLSSYPLTITRDSADMTSMLLSMVGDSANVGEGDMVVEQQYVASMFSNIKTNDIKSFKEYLEDNYKKVEDDIATIKYSYSVDPMIYTKTLQGKIVKVNPNSMFSSMSGGNGITSLYSSYSSVFTQLLDDQEALDEQYEVLAGNWPKKYNEMVLVLPAKNAIPDMLVYFLGLRDIDELYDMVTKLMSGESVEEKNEPLELSYDELMNIEFKLVNPTDTYKYNEKYKIYENMENDEKYIKNVYNKSESLKIVGIVTAKEGVSSMALSPGVSYRGELIQHIIDSSKEKPIVKQQLANKEIDVFTGKRFDELDEESEELDFEDMISIDEKMLESAFNIKIDPKEMEKTTTNYMSKISESITTDTSPARADFEMVLSTFATNIFKDYAENPLKTMPLNPADETVLTPVMYLSDTSAIVSNFLSKDSSKKLLNELEKNYVIPANIYTQTFTPLLESYIQGYIQAFYAGMPSLTLDPTNPVAIVPLDDAVISQTVSGLMSQTMIQGVISQFATQMTEAVMQKDILTNVGNLTQNLMGSVANAFDVNPDKIAAAFKFDLSEEELERIMSAMMSSNEKKSAVSNLTQLGYQDIEEPTNISFYFNSFEAKERFVEFIDEYNDEVEKTSEDKIIRYTDLTGILMSSVKTIVNSVTYVLIAFVSISLVVSSIMIGIITYISVFERTKEIGILRAIGASKGNISSIFNAETFIIGLLSGAFGIGVTLALIPIINLVIHNVTGNMDINAVLPMEGGITLLILSIILTIIGGLIPSHSASKKDPVVALRTE